MKTAITSIDLRKCAPLPKDLVKALQTLYWNLWRQFGLGPKEMKRLVASRPVSVTEFTWTKTAERDFYAHPPHRDLKKKLRKRFPMDWEMWALNSEPRVVEG